MAVRGRTSIGVMLVLLAAAAPVRIYGIPVLGSIAVLDVVLLLAGLVLYIETASRRTVDIGYTPIFQLLCIPLLVTVLSATWSQDLARTGKAVLINIEGIIVYLYMVRCTNHLTMTRVLRLMRWYLVFLLVPVVLLLLKVPGFAPQEPGLPQSSGDYISYYTRLSHPFLGRSNNLATALTALVIPLLWCGTRYRDGRSARVGALGLAAIILTFSRGVLLALLITAAAVILTRPMPQYGRPGRSARVGSTVFAAVSLLLVAAALLYELNPETHLFLGDRASTVNVAERGSRFELAYHYITERPLLGYGAGAIPGSNQQLANGVHNTYLQQLLAFGLPLGLLVIGSMLGLARFFFATDPPSPVRRILGFTLLAQLLIFVTESSFEGTVLRVLFYLSLGLAVGLVRAVEAQTPSGAEAVVSTTVGTVRTVFHERATAISKGGTGDG